MTPLDEVVCGAYGARATVVSFIPSIYATSHPIADVVVDPGDGRRVTLLHKDVASFLPGARAAKPAFLCDPGREPLVYRELLSIVDVGAPRLVGAGDGWLLLEKVRGVELYQVGDLEVWRTVARRAASMHRRFEGLLAAPASGQLLRCDGTVVDGWVQRAATGLRASPSLRWFEALRARYGEVRDRILSLPRTIIHGELYASNVLVDSVVEPVRRVCPIDWETAAVGPGLLDLAALVAGRWTEDERREIAAGYAAELPFSDDDLLACRLHLAVQWLGWSPGWSAPPEHAHDWLGEAQELAGRLGLT